MNEKHDDEFLYEQSWRKLDIPKGILTDTDIKEACLKGFLIVKNYDENQISQTCYDLRIGEVAYCLSKPENNRRIEIVKYNENGSIKEEYPLIIKPFDVVTIATYEEVHLPSDVVARIISKGYLFSLGLTPVITFVDPGFNSNLGISIINLSRKNVKLNYKESVCKIEFERLSKSVKKPYSHGSHDSIMKNWFFDTSKFTDNRIIKDEEIEKIIRDDVEYFGEPLDSIYAKIRKMEKPINILKLIVYLIIGLIILTGAIYFFARIYPNLESQIKAAVLGILGGFGGALLLKFIEKIFK